MALEFPISLNNFMDLAALRQMSFVLGEASSFTETGGGHILRSAIGTRLWMGEMAFLPTHRGEHEAFEGLLDVLREPGASFMIGDRLSEYPQDDPTGSKFGGRTLTVRTVITDRTQLSIAGALAGAKITAGDHIAIRKPTTNIAYNYHRVVVGSTVNAQGQAQVEVRPHLPLGLAVGDVVITILPRMKAVMVPNSYSGGGRGPGKLMEGSSISWVQTMR